jgi:predicted patatin/cPLA2 family phospholipase
MTSTIARTLIAAALLTLAGCSNIVRNPLPYEQLDDARLLGRQDLRYWGDLSRTDSNQYIFEHLTTEEVEQRYASIMGAEHNYLAISGGGANGAFGAGALVGWSEKGTRPEFTIVTGVSTGALMAPFAFLGSEYDEQLKEVYTTTDTDSIFNIRSIFKIVGGDGLVDTTPLTRTLQKYITDEMIKEIGNEYLRGRMLLIATTNLDANRPVIWNIGRIATTDHPDAGKLIRQILLASASIPGAFPPVYFSVEGSDGKRYDEMHVDGGAAAQMFLYPSGIDWQRVIDLLDVQGTPTAYLIRNSRITTEYEPVKPRTAIIAARTINSLIRTQGVGDAYRIYAVSERDGVDVQLTWIQQDAIEEEESDEAFDPEYMSDLFQYGYQRAINDKLWTDLDLE